MLTEHVKLEAVGRKFSHRPGNPTTIRVVRWPSAGDTAGYRLRRPELTPVSSISTTLIRGRTVGLFGCVERVDDGREGRGRSDELVNAELPVAVDVQLTHDGRRVRHCLVATRADTAVRLTATRSVDRLQIKR